MIHHYVLSGLLLLYASVGYASTDVQGELVRLLDETHFLRDKMEKLDEAIQVVQKQRRELTGRISLITAERDKTTAAIASQQTTLGRLTADIATATRQREELLQAHRGRLKSVFMRRCCETEYESAVSVAWSPRTVKPQFLMPLYEKMLFQSLFIADQELLLELEKLSTSLQAMRVAESEALEVVQGLHKDLETQRIHVSGEADELKAATSDLRRKRDAARKLLFEFEGKVLRLESLLADLQPSPQRQDQVEEPVPLQQPLRVPLQGLPVAKFLGWQTPATAGSEKRIEVADRVIRSVAAGTVVYIGNSQQRGRIVIVKHAPATYGVYGGVSESEVLRNEILIPGQTLGVASKAFFFELREGASVLRDLSQFRWVE
jgi:septal ring factor EnvC (AmiA/AmiB activator)